MDERSAYIALNMMEKVGPVTVRVLSESLGSAARILEADRTELLRVNGAHRDTVEAIARGRETTDWEAELARAEREGVRIIAQVDEEYPKQLREIHDPPLALYIRGSLQSKDRRALGIVGTRRPTHYGREVAGGLAQQLAHAGFAVVSGLALGIDTAAHEGALKAKGRTLAVMGGGMDCLYPASNEGLARRISEQGAVITEYPFGRQPDKTTFPVRNRIVSGLSMGVVVVEAGRQSGALITARQAAEDGRPVFAVPGRIDSASSQGCHDLIQQGAKLIQGLDDILQEFEFLIPSAAAALAGDRRPKVELTDEERAVARCVADGEKGLDSVIRESGLSAATVSSLLLGLEMKRVIRVLPGRMIEARREMAWE